MKNTNMSLCIEGLDIWNNNSTEILRGDSSRLKRESANTGNHYNVLFSEILPSWTSFPKRNRSWICSNNKDYAFNFGTPHYVFPVGDPLLGICPDMDWWNSFEKSGLEMLSDDEGMHNFNKEMELIAKDLGVSNKADKNSILNLCRRVDSMTKEEQMNSVDTYNDSIDSYNDDPPPNNRSLS